MRLTTAIAVLLALVAGPAVAQDLQAPNLLLTPRSTSPGDTGRLLFYELTANGENRVSFKSPDSLAADNNYLLPSAYPIANNYALVSSTTGTLSWLSGASLAGLNCGGVAGAVCFYDGTNLSGDATKLYWDNAAKTLAIGTNVANETLTVREDNALVSFPFGLDNATVSAFTGVGQRFRLRSSTGVLRNAATWQVQWLVNTNGAESSTFSLINMNAGAFSTNFQIEGVNAYVPSGGLSIGFATAPTNPLHIKTATANVGIRLERTAATTSSYDIGIRSNGNLFIAEPGAGDRIELTKTTGFLGIGGNTGPAYAVDVRVGAGAQSMFRLATSTINLFTAYTDANGDAYWVLADRNGAAKLQANSTLTRSAFGAETNNSLILRANAADMVEITNAGLLKVLTSSSELGSKLGVGQAPTYYIDALAGAGAQSLFRIKNGTGDLTTISTDANADSYQSWKKQDGLRIMTINSAIPGLGTDTNLTWYLWANTSANKIAAIEAAGILSVQGAFRFRLGADTSGNLGADQNGTMVYCTDCTKAAPCAGGGVGAMARKENGVWNCN